MEWLDIYTKDFKKTGKTILRGEKLAPGEYYYGIHIWIYNTDGKLLIQKRNKPFNGYDSIWLCTMGAVSSGETGTEAAVRETYEELGIRLNESTLKMIQRTREKNLFFREIHFALWNGSLNELRLDSVEVQKAAWADFDEIEAMIDRSEFYNFGTDYNQLIRKETETRQRGKSK